MGDSSEKSDFATWTPASEVDHATPSTSYFATWTPASEVDHATPSTSYFSAVEEQIEQSKTHWSMLADYSGCMDDDKVDFKVSNEREFLALQRHQTWGNFFANFTGDGVSTGFGYDDLGELLVGRKFAEGAQAELFEVHIKWNDPNEVEGDRKFNRKYALKVFKKGTLLKHVMLQLPHGLLQIRVESMKTRDSPIPKLPPLFISKVYLMLLLKEGRLAFLMQKRHWDLRTLIERKMKLISDEHCGPFSKKDCEDMMYNIALGVAGLHNHDIVHRDLKASNVLVHKYDSGWPRWQCFVADYECSIGVIGTGFFRAPEILQACKERKANERPEVFSRASDVYSYGMTCYEILTGKLPLEDHPLSDSPLLLIDLVINQQLRPEVPEYVQDWARELMGRCWQFDPAARPSIGEILNVLSINSARVRRREANFKDTYGENFRS